MDIRLNQGKTLETLYDADQHGAVNFLSGKRGLGKSHTGVQHAYRLAEEYGYSVITNIMFIDSNYNMSIPSNVHFCQSMRGLWEAAAEIREGNPTTPILILIDEIQEMIHRYRSTSYPSVVLDRFTRQVRKFKMSLLGITQNIHDSIPPNILRQADGILMKSNRLIDQLNRRLSAKQIVELKRDLRRDEHDHVYIDGAKDRLDRPFGYKLWIPPDHPKNNLADDSWDYSQRGGDITFKVDISQGRFIVYFQGEARPVRKKVKEFREFDIDLRDTDDILPSLKACEWTRSDGQGPHYDTSASASFEVYPLGDMNPSKWTKQFFKVISGIAPSNFSQEVFSFFERHEEEDGKGKNFYELSASKRAAIMSEALNIPYSQAAATFDISKQAAHSAHQKMDVEELDKHVENFLE